MSHHKGIFVNSSLTKKVLANMKRAGTGFSEAITPLFETMMRKHKSRRKQRKETAVPHAEPQTEEHIPTPSHDPLPSGEDRLQLNELMEICTKLSDRVLSFEQIKTNQAAEIEKLKKRVKKLKGKKKKRTHGLKRLYKGRIAKIDADEDLSLINDTAQDQGRINDQDMFGVNDLDGDEVVVDASAGEKEKQSEKVAEKEVNTADLVTTVGEVVTTANVEVSVALTTTITDDDVTLAQTLIEIKPAKPKAATAVTVVSTRPKENKFIMPLKRKEQIMMDEQIARDLEAQMQADLEEEQRIAKQKEEEANIAMIAEWDNTQAMMDKDYELATKLQEEERGELSIKKKSKLFVELMNKRKKNFKMLRAEERMRKPPTKAQKRKQLDENVQAEVADDTAVLKRCMEIVPEDDDEVMIEATPLDSKSPIIVDYKIYKEEKKSYFKIIEADGNLQKYQTLK
uniref:Uncharacterized protein n=2 Tax=Tanacetum cinerariifolium TaxID=118510 RepID=A0A6L2K3W3_TANCI|nr:hypothetical protein [Tanacetum cinerariifolium]